MLREQYVDINNSFVIEMLNARLLKMPHRFGLFFEILASHMRYQMVLQLPHLDKQLLHMVWKVLSSKSDAIIIIF
jgi:hypothetical protein